MNKQEESSNKSSGILDRDGASFASFRQAFLTVYCNVIHTQRLSDCSHHEKHLDSFICCSLFCSS